MMDQGTSHLDLDSEFQLPVTTEAYDQMIDRLMDINPIIKDKRHAAAVVSVSIRHLDPQTGSTTYRYLANCVIKALANAVANRVGELTKHEIQIEMIANELLVNPHNQQALDELTKAANEGSEKAKAALLKFNQDQGTVATGGSNVVSLKPEA